MLKSEKNNRYKVIIQNWGFCRHNSDIAQHPTDCLGDGTGCSVTYEIRAEIDIYPSRPNMDNQKK